MARPIGNRWQANAYVDGRRVRLIFNTKQEADAYERNPARGDKKLPTAASLRMAYEFLWRNTKNAHTQYYNTEALIRRLGEQRTLASITTAAIQDLILSWRREGLSGGTINRKLSHLSVSLDFLRQRGLIDTKPEFPKREQEGQGRERYLTEAEVEELFSHLSPKFRAFAQFLLHTGCRYGEAQAITWFDVKEDRIILRWETTKSKKTRVVGVNEVVAHVLAYARDQGWDRPWSEIDYDSWEAAFKRAKAKCRSLRNDREVVPHILRHTFGSWLAQRGVSIQRIQKLLGHSTPLTTMRYAKLAEDDALGVSALLVRQPADNQSVRLPELAIEVVRRPVGPLRNQRLTRGGMSRAAKGADCKSAG